MFSDHSGHCSPGIWIWGAGVKKKSLNKTLGLQGMKEGQKAKSLH